MVIKGVGKSGGTSGKEEVTVNPGNLRRNPRRYILQPEAILDHRVEPEGKRWYLVKWKPRWVKKHELPEGVWEKWQQRKNGVGLDEPQEGLRILEERRLPAGMNIEDLHDAEEEVVKEDADKDDPMR